MSSRFGLGVRGRRRSRLTLAMGIGALTVLGSLVPATTANATQETRDGLTASTALASCWDIKQYNSASTDGIYWIYTPALDHPTQIYCDMTTDGGGWELIGRGREGWTFLPEGQGTTAEVSATVSGTAAFAPKALSASVVQGLLNGGAVSDLTDGLRVRRAMTSTGSTYQEVRVKATMTDFKWTLGGGYPVSKYTFDSTSYTTTGMTTAAAALNKTYNSFYTQRLTNTNYQPGFGYGSGITGSSSSTSYLWSPTNSTYAVPFAQVYVRPKLRFADLTFDDTSSGLAASTVQELFSNFAEAQNFGVSGLANGLSTERDTEVKAMVEIDGTMYVGGNFAQVDNYTDGTSTAQSYLAAFDSTTGEWKSAFTPTLDGKVWAVAALPNGDVAVGGEFTTVNGQAQAGLVALDPDTGQIDASWPITVEKRTSTDTVAGKVTTMMTQGDYLYIGGDFTHIVGGTSSTYRYLKRGARIDAATGTPDKNWNPALDGGNPYFVYANSEGTRVYFGGNFTTMNDGATAADKFAVVSTEAGAAAVTGLNTWVASSSPAKYQQTAAEYNGSFFLGGSEHSFFRYDAATMTLTRGNIAKGDKSSGGDFQASVVDEENGVVYGSCHCMLSYTYGNATSYATPSGFDTIDSLRYVGAFDVETGKDVSAFTPWIDTRAVRGPWSLVIDSNECMWVGGDLTRSKVNSSTWQTSGGFAKFCRNDTTAPTTPTKFKSTTNADGSVTLSWTGSTDASSIYYNVYRDDLVVANKQGWSVTLPATSGTSTYRVRAYDKWGNYSATTDAITITN